MNEGQKPEGIQQEDRSRYEDLNREYQERAELAAKWWEGVVAEGKENNRVMVQFLPLYPKSSGSTALLDRIPLNENDVEAVETTEEVTNQEIKDARLMILDGAVVSAGNAEGFSGWGIGLPFGIVKNETEQ